MTDGKLGSKLGWSPNNCAILVSSAGSNSQGVRNEAVAKGEGPSGTWVLGTREASRMYRT